AVLLQEERELCVFDLDRLQAETALEVGGRRLALAERRCRPGPVELRAAPLEAEQRHNRARPRLGRRMDTRIERVGSVDPALEVRPQLVEPGAGEHPVARMLD